MKSWFNPDLLKFIELQNSGRELVEERADFACSVADLVKDPESFEDAFNHPEIDKKMKWRHTISKEFEEMKARGIWEKFKKLEIPNGQNCIKISGFLKRNQTEFVEHGWWGVASSQIPGVDLKESYAPVINDVTLRILLVTMLTWNLTGKVINIETAFLHGDLKETIFMEIPKDTEANKDECLILKGTIYRVLFNLQSNFIVNCCNQGLIYWSGDPESTISVSGYIMYLFVFSICWISKVQKGIILSSSVVV